MSRIPSLLVLALSLVVAAGCASSSGGGSSAAVAVPELEVTANSLNVRQEPSTSGAVVGSLKKGNRVSAPRAAENGWVYVEASDGTSGYVSARYVREVAGTATAASAPKAQPERTAQREAKREAEPEEAPPEKEPQGRPAPPGTKLAKVELGMNEGQVRQIMGEPTSQENYMTGKAWIPYYYGSDTSRLDYKYKGVGIVVFGRNRYSGRTRVIRVDYNPGEDGY